MTWHQTIDDHLSELKSRAPGGYSIGLHFRFAAPILSYQTYPDEWIEHYTRNAFALRDPMVAWALSEVGATRWSALSIPDPFGIIDAAASYGLKYGVSVSCGPISSRTIAGFARSDREFTDAEIDELSEIVEALHVASQPPTSLTPAEQEALRLVAKGERHADAAATLGISESAFKARLVSVRKRLFARTTAEALQRARDYRLI